MGSPYKTRNLVDQMKAMEIMLELRPISSTAFRLWFTLTMRWNRLKWTNSPFPFEFNKFATSNINISKSSIRRARNCLIENGYIAIKKGINANVPPLVYVCYLPQYIEDLQLNRQSSFDKLQGILDDANKDQEEQYQQSIKAQEPVQETNIKEKIQQAKKILTDTFDMKNHI